jgi:hypothetical protein
LALFNKSGRFEKYWRFSENQADLKNIGAFQKIRRIYKILAPCRKQADNRILAGVEIPAPGEKSADLEKVGCPLTVWARRNLQLLTSVLYRVLVPARHAKIYAEIQIIGGRVYFHQFL